MSDESLHEKTAVYRASEGPGEFDALAEEIYRDRVFRARRTPPEEKFLAGEELFDYACSITLAGIRHQFPSATEPECQAILASRLALREKMERPS